MKVWISVSHPAQLNFYSKVIEMLVENNEVLLTVLDRGKLVKIASKELSGIENLKIITLGRHRGTVWSAVFEANVFNFFSMLQFVNLNRPDIAVGNGFIHGIIGKMMNMPVLMFSDDIERKVSRILMKTFSDELFYVEGSNTETFEKDVKTFRALKEWAYLAPNHFHPDTSVLSQYGLEENKYIFVREVITGTLNYSGQEGNLIAPVSKLFPSNLKVVLSLEDKKTIDQYPPDWILLNEPLEDIHSLIYFSRLLVSSGDSMARESSILGVKSIYCGFRSMKANDVMIDLGMMAQIKPEEIPQFIKTELDSNSGFEKENFREMLSNNWIDVPNFILDRIVCLVRDN